MHSYYSSCIWYFFLSLLPLTLISTLSFSFHHSSLFLSSQLCSQLFLSSQLCTTKPISLSNPTIQSASPIISICCWTCQRHSAHMKMIGLLDEPWSSNPRPWWFRIRQVLAEAPLPSCHLDLWLLGFDRIYGFRVLISFLLFVWLVGFRISYG